MLPGPLASLRRVRLKAPRLGELVAGISAIVLLLVAPLTVYVLVAAAVGLALLLAEMTQRTSAVAVALSAFCVIVGAIAFIWIAVGLDSEWLALVFASGLIAGGAISGRDEGTDFWPGQEEAG